MNSIIKLDKSWETEIFGYQIENFITEINDSNIKYKELEDLKVQVEQLRNENQNQMIEYEEALKNVTSELKNKDNIISTLQNQYTKLEGNYSILMFRRKR